MTLLAALPWLVRGAWVVLPFTAGPALAGALDGRSGPVQTVASTGCWAVWAIGVLAVLAPRPVGLTFVRVAAPAALAAAVLSSDGSLTPAGAIATTLVTTVLAYLPETGWLFVNGAAYGDERRHLLRAPGALLLGPLPLAWLVVVVGVVAGPLLLAAKQWGLGVVVMVAGMVVAALCARALHTMTQRWVVFVPAGMVLKDHLTLVDPVLFRRAQVEWLGAAPAGTDALDLTARSPGLALELRLHEKAPLTRVVPGQQGGEPGRVARLLFTPTRPGAVLDDAAHRRLRTSLPT